MADQVTRTHTYHAEATALSGRIIQPLQQHIYPQAYTKLREGGGYLSQRSSAFRVEEVISYTSAYTQVAGNRDPKEDLGWSTLSTAVVEGLNILDVLTADRIVAQVSTVHPLRGHVPSISFLGTRFENLRIAGHKVELTLNTNLLGDKPEDDGPYIGTSRLSQSLSEQHNAVRTCEELPEEIANRYTSQPVGADGHISAHGSLAGGVGGDYPGRNYGHLIDVPNFGKIYLATFRLVHSDFEGRVPKKTLLEFLMLDVHMGCIGSGNIGVCGSIINGATVP